MGSSQNLWTIPPSHMAILRVRQRDRLIEEALCPYRLFWQILLTLLLWVHRADSINRPGGDSVHGVQRGTGAGKGEWHKYMREKEGMHGSRQAQSQIF